MPIQMFLDNETREEFEDTIIQNDIDISSRLIKIFEKIAKTTTEVRKLYVDSISLTQNIISTSFLAFQKPLFINNLAHYVPTFILQNIQLYEAILGYLYVHPCYIYKIIQSNLIDTTVALDLIIKIYGTSKNDDHVANIVIGLGVLLLKDDVKKYPINQASLFKLTSHTSKIYEYLLNLHTSNTNFFKKILDFIINKVLCGVIYNDLHRKYQKAKQEHKPDDILDDVNIQLDNNSGNNNQIDEDFEQVLRTGLSFDVNNENSSLFFTESNEEKIDRIIDALSLSVNYILELINEQDFLIKKKVSKHIKYLNFRIIEEYKLAAIDQIDHHQKMKNFNQAKNLNEEMERNEFITKKKAEI